MSDANFINANTGIAVDYSADWSDPTESWFFGKTTRNPEFL